MNFLYAMKYKLQTAVLCFDEALASGGAAVLTHR